MEERSDVKDVRICPVLSTAVGFRGSCIESDCAFWIKRKGPYGEEEGCAIVVLGDGVFDMSMIYG
ncbi:MAG TPA: hypothetical protein EYP19_10130 [Desulfobacterales bacterium]|nr:hypothetical protein [Desulfobacterales bacterium]